MALLRRLSTLTTRRYQCHLSYFQSKRFSLYCFADCNNEIKQKFFDRYDDENLNLIWYHLMGRLSDVNRYKNAYKKPLRKKQEDNAIQFIKSIGLEKEFHQILPLDVQSLYIDCWEAAQKDDYEFEL